MSKDTDSATHVLIVDDDPSTVLLMAHVLEPLGNIHVTTRGSQALELALAIRPDVILLDIEMPDADGLEVCQQVKAQAGLIDTPVLFVTSTRDDRVHPGHARKMAARMLEQGHRVRYWENIEGGHGGAADNAQRARMQAIEYAFLWQQLAGR